MTGCIAAVARLDIPIVALFTAVHDAVSTPGLATIRAARIGLSVGVVGVVVVRVQLKKRRLSEDSEEVIDTEVWVRLGLAVGEDVEIPRRFYFLPSDENDVYQQVFARWEAHREANTLPDMLSGTSARNAEPRG